MNTQELARAWVEYLDTCPVNERADGVHVAAAIAAGVEPPGKATGLERVYKSMATFCDASGPLWCGSVASREAWEELCNAIEALEEKP